MIPPLSQQFSNAARLCASSLKEGPYEKNTFDRVVAALRFFNRDSSSKHKQLDHYQQFQQRHEAEAPRKPIFRANKDQIKQAQKILKDRGFYAGEETGKLDDDTRAGLKKYQAAENLKVTGTLNKVTLEKMGVALTDKQKAM